MLTDYINLDVGVKGELRNHAGLWNQLEVNQIHRSSLQTFDPSRAHVTHTKSVCHLETH